ncbi:phage baseplate assembly protein V [Lysinibacillus fusiformis]|uniref:phage baseplate assembly protein V n=1 Tax=Lysinibacillus fusiformis TaxID=28031 RepID=UPI0035C0919E|nr:phage baseplate assembly protein V [Lysinibacillus fusiformis]
MRIQVGEVTIVDPTQGTARVKIEEQDGKVSSPLNILFRGTLKDKDYWMPKIGEHVLCAFTKQSEGFILGAFYSDGTTPPRTDPEKRCIEFEDGSFIEYDAKTRNLFLKIEGELNIETKGTVTINGQTLSTGGSSSS